jgi:hypothetical protein
MNIITICAAWLLQLVVGPAGPGDVPLMSRLEWTDPIDILHELGPLLSPGASITVPSAPGWDNLTARAAFPRVSPSYLAIVEVATEEDVQLTVSLSLTSKKRRAAV